MVEQQNQTDRPVGSEDSGFFLNRFFTAKILFLGLVIAQIIATIHVYLSNNKLFHSLEAINKEGYLGIPNQHVMKSLLELAPAFFGGLFFTLTVGALLSLLGLVSALIWDRFFKREKILLIPFLILWAGVIGELNIKGFCPLITVYFIFIPLIVFVTASRFMPLFQHDKPGFLLRKVNIIPILLIAALCILPATLCILQRNTDIFIKIRDNFLLSNTLGTKINDFYYQYTLYPAETIKSLDQKIIKTYRFDRLRDNILTDRIRRRLVNYDFLEVNEYAVDLVITEQNNSLCLINKGSIILTISPMDFLAKTDTGLKEFSRSTDRLVFFRRFILLSLLTGFPAVIIIFFYSILGTVLNLFYSYRHAGTISLYLCLAVAVLLSGFLYLGSGKSIDEDNLSEALRSGKWQNSVMALKIMDRGKRDISRFGNYQEMLSSPYIPVRYWLARALGTSRDPKNLKDLLRLMDDPCINVVCMAYYSIGERGNKSNIKDLLERIKRSDHWYEQWYAYKALRALGWKQTISE